MEISFLIDTGGIRHDNASSTKELRSFNEALCFALKEKNKWIFCIVGTSLVGNGALVRDRIFIGTPCLVDPPVDDKSVWVVGDSLNGIPAHIATIQTRTCRMVRFPLDRLTRIYDPVLGVFTIARWPQAKRPASALISGLPVRKTLH